MNRPRQAIDVIFEACFIVARSLFRPVRFYDRLKQKGACRKNGQAPLLGSKATLPSEYFILVLSNHYATILARDCNNIFSRWAISAAICPHCIQLSAQRMVIREDRKATGVLRYGAVPTGEAHSSIL
jgi:hypothetical protein